MLTYSSTVTKPTTMLCSSGPFFHGQLPYHVPALSPAAEGNICATEAYDPRQHVAGPPHSKTFVEQQQKQRLQPQQWQSFWRPGHSALNTLMCTSPYLHYSASSSSSRSAWISSHISMLSKEIERKQHVLLLSSTILVQDNVSKTFHSMYVLKAVTRLMYSLGTICLIGPLLPKRSNAYPHRYTMEWLLCLREIPADLSLWHSVFLQIHWDLQQ